MKKITSAGPSITQAEIDLVTEAVREGWGTKMNYYIDQFIEEFASYVGVDYCLPTSHCNDALHLAMLALEIGPGDEVIVPDMTWVSPAAAVVYVGASPVFADVDSVTWCLNAETIERCITSKTKAVVVVDLLGNMPEYREIQKLCETYGILIVEDSAQGTGATYEGKQSGTFGEMGLFSFNATKLIMSGQGGAFCTDDEKLYKQAKIFCHHGIDKSSDRYYWSHVVGYHYNWTNIQAALALAQLRRIDELIAYKKWLFHEYKKHLGGIEGITLNSVKQNVDSTYWIPTVILDENYGLKKIELCNRFQEYQIDMRPLFYPVSAMPPYQKYLNGKTMSEENPVTYRLSEYGICLPNGYNLDKKDVQYVCVSLKSILGITC